MDLYLNKAAQSPAAGLCNSLTDATPRAMYDLVAKDKHTVNIYLVENGALHADSGNDAIELGFYIGTPGAEELYKQTTWPGAASKWTAIIDLTDTDLLTDLGTNESKSYTLQIRIGTTGSTPITYMLQSLTIYNPILDAV